MKNHILEDLLLRHPNLQTQTDAIYRALEHICECYEHHGKILVCGNGGSCADSDHIVGELMKGFLNTRPLSAQEKGRFSADCPNGSYLAENLQGALPAISLCAHTSLSTAFANDVQPDMVFAQQVYGYGTPKVDILLAMSTSGNSANVINAVRVANVMHIPTIGISGRDGGKLREECSIPIVIAESDTYRIQEICLPLYHALCAAVEEHFFGTVPDEDQEKT